MARFAGTKHIGFMGRNLRDAQAKWSRLTPSDLDQIKTKAQLIARVQERYCLPHEVAAEDVDIWGQDRHF
ncbi:MULTISPECIES: CsbD family protein [Microvirga]|uniref:hypothetical protein n=1 Tax=Microvirga TaxID=186650 RepID=UPI001D001218|nr:hypothetical protein [Microvirga lenta]MCB5176234.1 hypothetical protein [Microvirga lenta]